MYVFLLFWPDPSFWCPEKMGIYAAIGISQAFWTFLSGAMFAFLSYFASKRLHQMAIERVLHAPMSFFETTVSLDALNIRLVLITRIAPWENYESFRQGWVCSSRYQRLQTINFITVDIDTVDNLLGDSLRMFSNTFAQIIGAIILISVSSQSFYHDNIVRFNQFVN